MSERLSPKVTEADEFVACFKETTNETGRKYAGNGGEVKEVWKDGDYLRKLERSLAKEGAARLALEVRLRRNQIDKDRAESILSGVSGGDDTPDKVLKLAKRLADNKMFGVARRLLKINSDGLSESGVDKRVFTEFWQKYAVYTYKDPDLTLEWRLDEALRILGKHDDLSDTKNRETLGIAGAIHKRKWEVDGRRTHLGRSLSFYLRGYAMGLHEEHVAADLKKEKRPTPGEEQTALDAVRGDILNYLRDNPTCSLQVGKETFNKVEREGDQGYNGINAAFILDLLARLEEEEMGAAGAASVEYKRESARLIREEIIRSVPALVPEKKSEGVGDAGPATPSLPGAPVIVKDDLGWLADEWWFYATVGEAHFGLKQFDKAAEWMVERPKKAGITVRLNTETPSGLEVPEWEYESTARQFARLARLLYGETKTEDDFKKTPGGEALMKILGDDESAVGSVFRGKFGLGLSGGGFRASLFHIGMLARLAELDVLRHVEVLSCVSGGSIIGAHYYLEVRKLLQEKTDGQIEREDYIAIVDRVRKDFLSGVQRNIRTRVAAEWVTNLKMIFWPGYTRTKRVGELYERELFARVEDIEERDANGVAKRNEKGETLFRRPVTGPTWMPDRLARLFGWKREERLLNRLKIYPKREDGTPEKNFKPRSHNWRRENKAPDLILNAASLNTGHNWQFTASYMGEPPAPLVEEIDSNYRLRRFYYDEEDGPKNYRDFRLGWAVAASSCVPGLFDPLILDDLYPFDPDKKLRDEHQISVRLVDGGACDNQGIASLLEQDCTVMLISDASGQMEADNQPSRWPFGVLLRTTSVVQARVRESQYTNIEMRRRASLLSGMMFIHLRQNLQGGNVTWKECKSSLQKSDFEATELTKDSTRYNVAADVQKKLAAIRTDLDSFSDAEAFALMASGYKMTRWQFEQGCVEGFRSPERTFGWPFLDEQIESAMKPNAAGGHEARREHLEQLLDAGGNLAFKIWILWWKGWALKILTGLLVAATLLLGWRAFQSSGASFDDVLNASLIRPSLYRWLSGRLTVKWIGLTIVGIFVTRFVVSALDQYVGKNRGKYVVKIVRWNDTLKSIAVGVGMSTLGFIAARIHLHIFDRFYLKYGKLDKFPK